MFLFQYFTNTRGLNINLCQLGVETVEHVVPLKTETMCALFEKVTTVHK
jgi:hypothetical protein